MFDVRADTRPQPTNGHAWPANSSLRKEPWLGDDQTFTWGDNGIERFARDMGISFTPALLARLRDHGRGQVESLLEQCGADVVQAFSALEAAQAVSKEELDGVITLLKGSIDAEFAIADLSMRGGVPFMLITEGVERPSAMGLGGMLLHNLRSIDEVICALKTLLRGENSGLNLPPTLPAPVESDDADSSMLSGT